MESEEFSTFFRYLENRYFPKDNSDGVWKYAIHKKGIFLYTLLAEQDDEKADPHNAAASARNSIFVDKELKLTVFSGGKRIDLKDNRLTEYAQLGAIMQMLEEAEETKGSEEILEEAVNGDDFYQNVEYLESNDIYPSLKEQSDKSLQCPICGKCFKKASTLRDHQNIHNNLKPHVCLICTRSFSFETSLASHIKLHENIKNYKCSYCSKAFARRRNMILHERTIHLKEKPYACPICEKPYTDPLCWRKHIASHEAPKEVKPVPCRVKPKRAKEVRPRVAPRVETVVEVKTRQRRNTGPKRYKCDLCDKMFARRRNVLHHMTYTHNKIKPHECQFCGKKYSDITSFKRHIRGHTDPEVQRPAQLAPEATTVVSELLVGNLGGMEFTPEGSDDTITFIVITDG